MVIQHPAIPGVEKNFFAVMCGAPKQDLGYFPEPHHEKGGCWLSPSEHLCHNVTSAPPVTEAAVPPRISPKGQAFGSTKEREREGKGVRNFPENKKKVPLLL